MLRPGATPERDGLRALIRFTNVYGDGMGHKDSYIPRPDGGAADGGEIEVYGTASSAATWSMSATSRRQSRCLRAERPSDRRARHSYTVNEITTKPLLGRQDDRSPPTVAAGRCRPLSPRYRGPQPSGRAVALLDVLRSAWRDFLPEGMKGQ
jgi:hypothetical protein